MRIHLLSDIHLEIPAKYSQYRKHPPFAPKVRDADVTVLAGDVHSGEQTLEWARKTFAGRVLIVAGNHEFWGSNMRETVRRMREASCERVRFLERDEVVWDGVRFLGATCWTDYQALGDPFLAQLDAIQFIRDFQRIRVFEGSVERFVSPQDLLAINQETHAWLTRKLLEEAPTASFDKTVVITHHAPLGLCGNDGRFPANRHITASYVNHWPHLLGPRVPLWLYGHTHMPFDQTVLGTRIVSNPVGYPDERTGYDPNLILRV